jgi:hypothetical protein
MMIVDFQKPIRNAIENQMLDGGQIWNIPSAMPDYAEY